MSGSTRSRAARKGTPSKRRTARPTPRAGRAPAATASDDHLPPRDRGPVRAFVRDAVDARRRLVGLFAPVFGMALITTIGPASPLQHNLQIGSFAALAVIVIDAVLLGTSITRMARVEFPNTQVSGPSTGWYVFMRAHRMRSMRRPAPRVRPGR